MQTTRSVIYSLSPVCWMSEMTMIQETKVNSILTATSTQHFYLYTDTV